MAVDQTDASTASELEREVARAHTVYGPEHPKMLELEAELTNAKARLENEVTKARDAVEREHLAATRRANELGRRVDSQRDLAIQQYARQTQLQLLRKEAEVGEVVAPSVGGGLTRGAVVTMGKQFFYDQVEKPLADAYSFASEGMARNMMLADAAEGIDAFLAKRKPRWRGK